MKMELVVLDESFQSVAVIDSYKSLLWADRYNEYGDFELYLRMDNVAQRLGACDDHRKFGD